MTMPVSLYMVSAKESMTLMRGLPFSPAKIAAIPRKRAKTIIWSMLACAMEATGFFGKRSMMTWPILGGVGIWKAERSAPRPIPAPGLMILPRVSPMAMAMAVVTR